MGIPLTIYQSSHCLASGDVLVSHMGDKDGKAQGGFVLIDSEFNIKGRWEKNNNATQFGYDFWYQPRHNVMVSSGWGEPNSFKHGFNPAEVPDKYGRYLWFWDWKKQEVVKKVVCTSGAFRRFETNLRIGSIFRISATKA
jgi:selenium-binding protein 1